MTCTPANTLLQVLLQEAAWTESSRHAKLDVRRRAMSQHAVHDDLEREPLFCIETALKVRVRTSASWLWQNVSSFLAPVCDESVPPSAGLPAVHFAVRDPQLKCGLSGCTWLVPQAFHFSFISYRYEEHAGADANAASQADEASPDDPNALEVRLSAFI